MFVRAKKKFEDRWQVQIVETKTVGGKPRQKIVRNVGTAHNERELQDFKAVGESIIVEINNAQTPVLGFADPDEFHASKKRVKGESINIKSLNEEKRINQGFQQVMKPLFDDMALEFDNPETSEIVSSLVMARAFKPSSKLKSQETLAKYFDLEIPLHKIYRSMDSLADKEASIKKSIADKTFDLLNHQVDIMFFDVTTLSFESQKSDEIRNFGYSKDCKFNEVQVVVAMVTTTQGLPITYKMFPGNQFEGHTLIPIINELRQEFRINKVFLAADRGMFNQSNLDELDRLGIEYVVAAKLKTMKKCVKNEILSDKAYADRVCDELMWLKELKINSRRLIISFSSKRAKKDRADRQRLIDRLLKKTKDGKVPLKSLISNHGSKKFIKTDGETSAEIDYEKLALEQEWDGLFGIISNTTLSPKEIIERHRGLWQIEESFRINKHTLKMRPIFHWNPKRIKGHLCLCFITYALVRRIQFQLKEAGSNISIDGFLEALTDIQSSVLVNKFSGKKYLLPSKLTPQGQQIFDAFSLKRKTSIQAIN